MGKELLMKGNKNVAGGGYCRRIFSSGGMNKILAHWGISFSAGGGMGEIPQ